MERISVAPLAVRLVIAATVIALASGPSSLARRKDSKSFTSSFFVVFPRYTYPQRVHEIGDVDFRNLEVRFFKPDGKCCDYAAELANGRSFVRHELENDDVALLAVNYVDPSPTHPAKLAVAIYSWTSTGGSASGYGAVNLYEVVNNKLVLLQQIDFIAQTPDTGAVFDSSTRTVIVTASRYENDPHCCPSRKDVISFRWTGQFFQKTSVRTIDQAQNR